MTLAISRRHLFFPFVYDNLNTNVLDQWKNGCHSGIAEVTIFLFLSHIFSSSILFSKTIGHKNMEITHDGSVITRYN